MKTSMKKRLLRTSVFFLTAALLLTIIIFHEWCIDYWSDEPLADNALRNEVYFYDANSLPKIRVIKGGFNFDTNGIYEKSITDYLCPDVRLKIDLYRCRYHDDTSGGLGNLSTSLVTTESGIRLVQKRHE